MTVRGATTGREEAGRNRVLPPPGGGRDAMPAILALSLLVHVAAITTAALLTRAPTPPPAAEVAVEVVPEMPKEAPKPTEDDAAKGEAAAAAQAKAEQAKPAEAAPDKADEAKLAEAKAKREKAEQAEAAEAKAEEARAQQEKAAQAAQAEQARIEQAAEQAERQSMRDELAKLQAEQQALKQEAQAAQEAQPAQQPPAEAAGPGLRGGMAGGGQPAGVGPLASSLQAIALPQETTDGEGELAGYQAVVFSRLAKAKAVGRQLGIPGSAGVSFTVDAHGALKSLRLAVPSGIRKLDEEALAIVRKAAPFPAPPEGARRSFEANVTFVAGG